MQKFSKIDIFLLINKIPQCKALGYLLMHRNHKSLSPQRENLHAGIYNGIAFSDTFVLLHPSLKILEDFIK